MVYRYVKFLSFSIVWAFIRLLSVNSVDSSVSQFRIKFFLKILEINGLPMPPVLAHQLQNRLRMRANRNQSKAKENTMIEGR